MMRPSFKYPEWPWKWPEYPGSWPNPPIGPIPMDPLPIPYWPEGD